MHKIVFLFFFFLQVLCASAQSFSPVQINPFGWPQDTTNVYISFELADMDRDGKFDFLYTDGADIEAYMILNKGTPTTPSFHLSAILNFSDFSSNKLGIGDIFVTNSRFADFDKDGDLDLLEAMSGGDPVFGVQGGYRVKWNQPDLFGATNYKFLFLEQEDLDDFGIPKLPFWESEYFLYEDIDKDGDDDILAMRFNEETKVQDFYFYERLTPESFLPATKNPFNLPGKTAGQGGYLTLCMLDADDDGDSDMLSLDQTGAWSYYQNTGGTLPYFMAPVINPFGLTSIPGLGSIRAFDVNGDGKKDVVATDGKYFYFFQWNQKVSVSGLADEQNIRIFPTLIYDRFRIEGIEPEQIAWLHVLNVNGRVQGRLGSHLQMPDVSSLPSGIYWLYLYTTEGRQINKKFLKY